MKEFELVAHVVLREPGVEITADIREDHTSGFNTTLQTLIKEVEHRPVTDVRRDVFELLGGKQTPRIGWWCTSGASVVDMPLVLTRDTLRALVDLMERTQKEGRKTKNDGAEVAHAWAEVYRQKLTTGIAYPAEATDKEFIARGISKTRLDSIKAKFRPYIDKQKNCG